MHEFSIVTALLDLVAEDVRRHNASKACRICVKIGVMSGVETELFEEAFHTIKRGTVAEEAALEIIRQPIEISCSCGYSGEIVKMKFLCPECGNRDIQVTDGEEMILQQLEMEVDDTDDIAH